MTAHGRLWLALAGALLLAAAARADAPAAPAPRVGLQDPMQRSLRYSAYTLPQGTWEVDVGALGTSSGDVYGRVGVGRGFAHGIHLDLNFLHWGAGLFNVGARWNFLDTRHVAMAVDAEFIYAHGAWVWILGDVARDLISDADLITFPLSLTTSANWSRWLELDLQVQYRHSEIIGSLGSGASFYAEAQIGSRQILFRPTGRLFITDATALEVSARLPAYNRVPYDATTSLSVRDDVYSRTSDGYASVAFSASWNVEVGLRSRLRPWLFTSLRLQYGQIEQSLYGAALIPSFNLEFRL